MPPGSSVALAEKGGPQCKAKERESVAGERSWGAEGGRRLLGKVSLNR